MADKPLWILGCELCKLFIAWDDSVKLYWPENKMDIKKSEFIIVDCPTCGKPIVVYRDHVSSILSESWGRILYRCRKIFGNSIKLHLISKCEREHLNYHIIKEEF